MDELRHPAIQAAVHTCETIPDQWKGTLRNGRAFYFRYRFGWASLAIGLRRADVDGYTRFTQVKVGTVVTAVAHGDGLRGAFDSDRERSEVFAHLYALQRHPTSGDVRCHQCGEYVNVKCWACGWVRTR